MVDYKNLLLPIGKSEIAAIWNAKNNFSPVAQKSLISSNILSDLRQLFHIFQGVQKGKSDTPKYQCVC